MTRTELVEWYARTLPDDEWGAFRALLDIDQANAAAGGDWMDAAAREMEEAEREAAQGWADREAALKKAPA